MTGTSTETQMSSFSERRLLSAERGGDGGWQRMMDRWKKWPMWAGFGVSCDTHVTRPLFFLLSLYMLRFFFSSLLHFWSIECSGPLSFVLLPRTPFCRDKRERERERERTRGSFRTAENFLWDKSAEIEADSSVQASETIIWNVNERVAYS